MIVLIDYASPSLLDSSRDQTTVGFSTNLRRRVRFHGVVRQHGFMLRIALRALGEAIWSNDMWFAQSDLLDPVITVHRDRIAFEAFSQDQSAYVALIVDPSVFESLGEVVCGTTNIDFTAWLWGALGEMRSSRSTVVRIRPEGLDVRTAGAGGRWSAARRISTLPPGFGARWGGGAAAVPPFCALALKVSTCAPPAPAGVSRRKSTCPRVGCAVFCRCRPPWACRGRAWR